MSKRCLSLLASVTGAAVAFIAGSALAAPPNTITVGQLTLTFCNTDYTGYCGAIVRPLDPSGVVPGSLSIGFEFYPRTDTSRPGLGTIVPQEGGPGYSCHRHARLLSQPLRFAAESARCTHHRQARHGLVESAQLSGVAERLGGIERGR